MTVSESFRRERHERISGYGMDQEFQARSRQWIYESMRRRYVYNFEWLGRPIIQYPQDIVAIQEVIWKVKPELIIETGIAHGGSLILSASLLALLDMFDSSAGKPPRTAPRMVIGIDVDIREHNREAIENHPLSSRITMLEGSSVSPQIASAVQAKAAEYERVMVLLDSMHTHEHVLNELELYAKLVSPESYCIVFDTFVETLPRGFFSERPWDVGNNPYTAVHEFLGKHPEFEVDHSMQYKLQITVSPDGFLRRVK